MFNRLTVRLLLIVSLVTLLVMSGFIMVRYHFSTQLMENAMQERSTAVASRVANSVRSTIWNIYQKSYDRKYTDEFAKDLLDAEIQSDFVNGIIVFGNFGHLYMGRIKDNGSIRSFDNTIDEALWSTLKNTIRYPVKSGTMTIGNVEVFYSDKEFANSLKKALLVDIGQVAVVSFLFVWALYILLKVALVSPMQSLQIAQRALDSLDEAVFVTNKSGKIIDINPSYSRITQFNESEVIGTVPNIYSKDNNHQQITASVFNDLIETDSWSGEVVGQRKNNKKFAGWLTINKVESSDKTITFVGVLNDIEEKKAAQEKLHHLAYFDALTAIPNRRSFMIDLEKSISKARQDSSILGLLFIDLDKFKWTNDTFGHDIGDALLVELAKRFKQELRASDTLYRIGGDEFTVIVKDYHDSDALLGLAQRLINTVHARLIIEGNEMKAGASIGIATYPKDADSAQELIKCADSAMFKAKDSGRGQAKFFS